MTWTLQKKTLACFILALSLAGALGAFAYDNTLALIQLNNSLRHTRDVIVALDHTLAILEHAEAEQRGYLITGDPRYLSPYNLAGGEIGERLRSLERLTADDPGMQADVRALQPPIDAKLHEMAEAMATGRQSRSAHPSVVLTQQDRDTMDESRRATERAVQRETRTWNRLTRERGGRNRAILGLIVLLIGSEFALLLWTYGLVRRDLAARTRTRDTLAATNQELEFQQEELLNQQSQLEENARELAEANARLQYASHRFEELYQALPVPCFCFDDEGRIAEWNRAFEAYHGLEPSRIFQMMVWEAASAPDQVMQLQGIVARVIAGSPQENWEQTLGRPDGTLRHLLGSAFPMHGQDGGIIGGISTHMDITERKLAECQAEESRQRYKSLFDYSTDAVYSFDLEGRFQSANAVCATLCGYSVEELLTMSYEPLIAPEDREGVVASFRQAVQGKAINYEIGIITRDGARRDVHVTNLPMVVHDEIVGVYGIAKDVTERNQAQAALIASEGRFRSAIEAMAEGLIVMNGDGVICLCNQSAEQTLQLRPDQLGGWRPEDAPYTTHREDGSVFPPDEYPLVISLRTGVAQRDVVMHLSWPNGEWVWVTVNSMPLYRNGEPAPYAAVATFVDITERRRQEAQIAAHLAQIKDYTVVLEFQKQELEAKTREMERANLSLEVANASLESLATLDGLTGLKNHRVLQEKLEDEMRRAQRYGLPLSLILLDVDHFKLYNDAFGHPAGDEVLQIVGRLLAEGERETDLAARYGGEEFAVILPNTDSDGARAVAERLRDVIAGASWPNHPITASFGVSTLMPGMTDRTAFITEADAALYRAKAAGRNCAIHAADPVLAEVFPKAA